MQKFWLLNQHGEDGPTALVATDGRLRVVDVLKFGPSLTELEDQQRVWDDIVGQVAPTLKPCVKASSIDEEGIAPHSELEREDTGGSTNRADRRDGVSQTKGGGGRSGGGPSRTGSRGER